jgi:predicted RNA-binding Zn-ribbon protein involved in translation (DUF1610 family)
LIYDKEYNKVIIIHTCYTEKTGDIVADFKCDGCGNIDENKRKDYYEQINQIKCSKCGKSSQDYYRLSPEYPVWDKE